MQNRTIEQTTEERLPIVNERFRNYLEELLPSMSTRLSLRVCSKAEEDKDWKVEVGSTMTDFVIADYMEPDFYIPDSRKGEWGRKKQLLWEIMLSNGINATEILRDFLTYYLKRLSRGIINCKIFEDIGKKNQDAIDHLFSEKDNQEVYLRQYVDRVMRSHGLPGKSTFSQLSAQLYERRPMHGSIAFLEKEEWQNLLHGAKEGEILSLEVMEEDSRFLEMSNMRTIRKIMEMCLENNCVVAIKEENRHLLCGIVTGNILKTGQYPKVSYMGYLKWAIGFMVGDSFDTWFSCDNGTYTLSIQDNTRYQWRKKLESLKLKDESVIIDVIEKVKQEKHGTSVVFMDALYMEKEIDRLEGMNRFFKMSRKGQDGKEEGIKLISYLDNLKGITAIDGAILADLDGMLYAIGAILDGQAIKAGNMSRGARYNSVTNYLYVKKKEYPDACVFGVIVSEDETVEIVIPEK